MFYLGVHTTQKWNKSGLVMVICLGLSKQRLEKTKQWNGNSSCNILITCLLRSRIIALTLDRKPGQYILLPYSLNLTVSKSFTMTT